MRTIDRPVCPVCAKAGDVLYEGLQDRLFGAPGEWRMRRCGDKKFCGTLWLDPAPHPEDLHQAYTSYYTHSPDADIYDGVLDVPGHQVWAAWRLKYSVPDGWRPRLSALRMLFRPREIERALFFRLYLPQVTNGQLLDVGCGAGDQLLLMQRLGWRVTGIDLDEAAVLTARQRGLNAERGSVMDDKWSPRQFDAITLVHVIEHMNNFELQLKRCSQLLRDQGRLMIITPNAKSLGHQLFKRDWRGLEPPRHLQLFNEKSLQNAVERAGLAIESCRTTARDARYTLFTSYVLSAKTDIAFEEHMKNLANSNLPLKWHLLELYETLAAKTNIAVGEEICLIAKPKYAS